MRKVHFDGTVAKMSQLPEYRETRKPQKDYGKDMTISTYDNDPTGIENDQRVVTQSGRLTSSAGNIPESSYIKSLATGKVPKL